MSRDVTERLAFAVAKRLRSAVSARAHRERLVTSSMVTLETLTMRQIADVKQWTVENNLR